jgi:Protein of unknown function (Hypoth_ymh)
VLGAALALRDLVRERSGLSEEDDSTLIGKALAAPVHALFLRICRRRPAKNVQRGMLHLAQGIAARVRNVLTHENIELEPAEAMEMVEIISRIVRDVMAAPREDAHGWMPPRPT